MTYLLEKIFEIGVLFMEIQIGNKRIGDNNPVFIVAELSGNHCQNFALAVKTLKAMKKAGADAVKLQTYTPDTITLDCDNKYFQIKQGTIWDGRTLYKLYLKAYTPWEWQPKLKKFAEKLGLICFSSPFDETAVDFLEKMDVPAYKIGSPEIVDIPLIKYIAAKGKPVMIATGVADLQDIKLALDSCYAAGNKQIILLKCTSAYPTPFEEVNLGSLIALKKKFRTLIGLSDHTLGISVPIAAVALGAMVVEKHFILDRKLGGPDAQFSLEPKEFKAMVDSIRDVEKALGEKNYRITKTMKITKKFSPSLFIVKNIKKNEVFTKDNVRSIRPGYGLPPKYYKDIIGKKSKKDIKRGTPLKWNMILE